MSAPTRLDETDDDLALPERIGGHDYRRGRDGSRLLHLASCSCWRRDRRRAAAVPELCRFCKKDHGAGKTCRWSTWLNFGRSADAERRRG